MLVEVKFQKIIKHTTCSHNNLLLSRKTDVHSPYPCLLANTVCLTTSTKCIRETCYRIMYLLDWVLSNFPIAPLCTGRAFFGEAGKVVVFCFETYKAIPILKRFLSYICIWDSWRNTRYPFFVHVLLHLLKLLHFLFIHVSSYRKKNKIRPILKVTTPSHGLSSWRKKKKNFQALLQITHLKRKVL